MHLALLRRRGLMGPAGALFTLLFTTLGPACASTPKGGPGTEGASCEAHAECAEGFVCAPDEETCVADECTTGDDCSAKNLGESRCATVEGAPAVQRCDFDGYRCMEWAADSCPADATCGAGPAGAACLGADGRPVTMPDQASEDAADAADGDEG